ncbi:hypothetical protein, partial [Komagataeibacter kakiaceti]|uniref:hypothetical protein n=1 Tax=Komagataeibacter kakiaceti TaxID=943261 RepID=UPI001A7EFAAF
ADAPRPNPEFLVPVHEKCPAPRERSRRINEMTPRREVRKIQAPCDKASKTPENSQPNRAAMCGLLSSPHFFCPFPGFS